MKSIFIVVAIAAAAIGTVLVVVKPLPGILQAGQANNDQSVQSRPNAAKPAVQQMAVLPCSVKGRAVLIKNGHARAFRKGIITFRYKSADDNWVFVRKRLQGVLRPTGRLTYRVAGKILPNSPCVAEIEGPVV